MKAAKLSDPAEVVSANMKSDVFMPLCLNSVHNYWAGGVFFCPIKYFWNVNFADHIHLYISIFSWVKNPFFLVYVCVFGVQLVSEANLYTFI